MAEYTTYSGYLDLSRKLTTEEHSILDHYLDKTFTREDIPEGVNTCWCSWKVSSDGEYLYCEENTDGDSDQPWLEHLIEKFFKPWGVVVSGELEIESSLADAEPAFFQVSDNEISIVEASVVETDDLTELRAIAQSPAKKVLQYFAIYKQYLLDNDLDDDSSGISIQDLFSFVDDNIDEEELEKYKQTVKW